MRRTRPILTAIVFTLFAILISHPGFAKSLTSAEKKLLKKPLPFLSFDEVASLEINQRVKYIREMRRVYLEIEKLQKVFGASYAVNSAGFNSKDLYAVIFGNFAEASAGRGLLGTDQCIYGFQLSKYPDSGRLQPGECQPPNTCQGPGGEGVQCGFGGSGIRIDNSRGCIAKAIRYRATDACDVVRKDLMRENSSETASVIQKAIEKFKISKEPAGLTRAELESAENLGALRELMNHAYDDKAYAYMMYVLSIYKKAKINVDFAKLDPAFKDYSIDSLSADFNNNQWKMNQIFQGMDSHCNQNLKGTPDGEKVIAALKNPDYRKKVDELAQAGNKFWNREKDRTEMVQAFEELEKQGASAKYTVKNLTEVEECRILAARMDAIIAELTPISNSIAECIDCTEKKDNGEVIPPPPPKPDVTRQANGCSRKVTAQEYLLAQPAAQCAICDSEKAMQKSTGEGYTVSRKWMSFMSTMILACGDGSEADEVVDPKTLAAYREAFGVCSNDTYEWSFNDEDSMKDKIRQWSTDKSYWAKSQSDNWWDKKLFGNKTPPPDENNDFTKVYGIKYATATKLFCDPDRFKKNWYGRLKNLKKERGITQGVSEFRAERQEHFKTYKKKVKPDDKDNDSAANALLECMDEGVGVTKGERRRDSNGNLYTVAADKAGNAEVFAKDNCVRYADVATASDVQLNEFAADLTSGESGATISNVASCRVHTFTETAKGGTKAAGFEYPNRPNVNSRFGVYKVPESERPAALILTHNKGVPAQPEDVRQNLIKAQAKTFSYIDKACRSTSSSREKSGGSRR